MPKLEYFLSKLPESLKSDFASDLAHSPREKDQILRKLLANLESGPMSGQTLYRKLYPGKSFNEKQIRNLRSTLFQRLQDFMASEELKESRERNVLLARCMMRHGISRYQEGIYQSLEKKIMEAGLGFAASESLAALSYERLQHEYQAAGRKKTIVLEVIGKYEEAFVLRMIYLALVQYSHRSILGNAAGEEATMMPFILQSVEAGRYASSPAIDLHYRVYFALHHPKKEDAWESVRELLTEKGACLEPENLKELYLLLINHAIRKLNAGHKTYQSEIYQMYQEMLDKELIGAREISPWQFKTIATLALRLNKSEAAERFIEDYGPRLNEEFRLNGVRYARGLLAYHLGDYAVAEGLMNRILDEFEDPFLGLDARAFLMRIAFETGNDVGMETMPEAFRKYLKRHRKIKPERRKNYEEFIRFYRRLVRLKPGKEKQHLKLKTDIVNSPYNAGRDWLLKKLAEVR